MSDSSQQETKKLLGEIKRRVASRDLIGLWVQTERFLALVPAHKQVAELHARLQVQRREWEKRSATVLQEAEQEYRDFNDAAVLRIVGHWKPGLPRPERVVELTTLATDRQVRADALHEQIQQAFATQAHNEIRPQLDEYLALRPNDTSLANWRDQLFDHDPQKKPPVLAAVVVSEIERASRSKRQRLLWVGGALVGIVGALVGIVLLGAMVVHNNRMDLWQRGSQLPLEVRGVERAKTDIGADTIEINAPQAASDRELRELAERAARASDADFSVVHFFENDRMWAYVYIDFIDKMLIDRSGVIVRQNAQRPNAASGATAQKRSPAAMPYALKVVRLGMPLKRVLQLHPREGIYAEYEPMKGFRGCVRAYRWGTIAEVEAFYSYTFVNGQLAEISVTFSEDRYLSVANALLKKYEKPSVSVDSGLEEGYGWSNGVSTIVINRHWSADILESNVKFTHVRLAAELASRYEASDDL